MKDKILVDRAALEALLGDSIALKNCFFELITLRDTKLTILAGKYYNANSGPLHEHFKKVLQQNE